MQYLSHFHSDQTLVFAGEFIWGVCRVQAIFGEYAGSTEQIWGVQTKFGEYVGSTDKI